MKIRQIQFVAPGKAELVTVEIPAPAAGEVTVRLAVSLGGDADTLACIAGSMAEAWCGVPEELQAECRARLDKELLAVVDRFDATIGRA